LSGIISNTGLNADFYSESRPGNNDVKGCRGWEQKYRYRSRYWRYGWGVKKLKQRSKSDVVVERDRKGARENVKKDNEIT
jgi:hypothetical protein